MNNTHSHSHNTNLIICISSISKTCGDDEKKFSSFQSLEQSLETVPYLSLFSGFPLSVNDGWCVHKTSAVENFPEKFQKFRPTFKVEQIKLLEPKIPTDFTEQEQKTG